MVTRSSRRAASAPGDDGSLRQSPRVGLRRHGCARPVGGRLRLICRQLQSRRVAIDAGARGGPSSSDVEARPDSPEASVAHRVMGMTCWFAGEYREARDRIERALALFQPGRDDDLAFRFGLDPGVAAMAYLAIVSWPLGDVDHAYSLVDRLHARIACVTHIGSRSWGTMLSALFDMMRGDLRAPRQRRSNSPASRASMS